MQQPCCVNISTTYNEDRNAYRYSIATVHELRASLCCGIVQCDVTVACGFVRVGVCIVPLFRSQTTNLALLSLLHKTAKAAHLQIEHSRLDSARCVFISRYIT